MSKQKVRLMKGQKEVNGKITLLGVLDKVYDILARHWNGETQSRYNGYYNQLCPILNGPLEDYDQEAIERAVAQIRPNGDSVAGKMLYLIRIVVKYAAENGLIPEDYLWGSGYSTENAAEKDVLPEERSVLRKSLTVQEEITVAKELMEDPYQVGQKMGLLLMFALGLRNNEACAVTYEAIKALRSHPECHVTYIYETADEGGELKAGGKTTNVFRIVYLPKPVYQLLMERKEWIDKRIKAGELQLPPGVSDIDQLTIACNNDTLEGYKPSDLGKAGRQLFKTIHMSEDQFALIDRAMRDRELCEEMGIREKEPTAYLLRRNYATHLKILGLTQAEIEYVMGHEILSNEIDRGDYENEDLLYGICRKLARRPLLNDDFDKTETLEISGGGVYTFANAEKYAAHIKLRPGETLRVRIEGCEPVDAVAAKLSVDKPYDVCLPEVSCLHYVEQCDTYSPEINILLAYHATYRKALNRRKKGKDSLEAKEDIPD